ncbi:uncharacterized protein LOC110674339 [Aedes aegypti]|uniref:Uncharacterized protein n=1 Tax=Aedes aegypti TaxID=7159 RepID=A0A6I8TQ58_AEDAE|nr:uncharacterized protein LOC110674339 [Aedes aegypti]
MSEVNVKTAGKASETCVTAAAYQKKSNPKLETLKSRKPKKVSTKTKEKKPCKSAKHSVDKKKAQKVDKVTTSVRQRSKVIEQEFGTTRTNKIPEVSSKSGKDKPVAGTKDAKSIMSTSSRRSERMVLEVQLKKLEAEQTLMEEEMKKKRELLERKFSLLEEIAEVASNRSVRSCVADDQQDPAEKVSSWLQDQETDESSRSDDSRSTSDTSEDSSVDDETSEEESSTGLPEDDSDESEVPFKPCKQSTPKGY